MAKSLKGDAVFGALTRPQMFAGVTYGYFVANAVVTAELFLLTRSFMVLVAAGLFHMVGYWRCLREPRFFDLWMVRASRTPRVKNWRVWRCNSYRP
jgi:type IV secretion system protein VirB3